MLRITGMMRARLAALFMLCALPAGATPPAESADSTPARPKAVLLAPKVVVYDAGIRRNYTSDVDKESTRANLTTSLMDVARTSANFDIVPAPTLTADEQDAVDEVSAVLEALVPLKGQPDPSGLAGDRHAPVDWHVGRPLAFLRERTGADFALVTIAYQVGQTPEAAVLGTGIAVAGTLLVAPMLPPITPSFVAACLVDLRTGELAWFKVARGVTISGIAAWDLRDPVSAAEVIAKTWRAYPEPPDYKVDHPPAASTGTPTLESETTPRSGGFGARPPSRWNVLHGRHDLTFTLNGPLLNQIEISLREHYRALPTTGVSTSRRMAAAELAELYVAELRAASLEHLEIREVSTTATLAEKPAFRIRFSYRQPLRVNDLPVEQVTVGTAVDDGLLLAQYVAPSLNFFEQTLPTFEKSAASITRRPRR